LSSRVVVVVVARDSAPRSFSSLLSSSSLEQRNEELEGQLAGLRTNLSQQRRWYQAVQVRIRESERARAAAEARNATVEREMEQVLDNFGELNNEAKKAERIVRSF